MYCTNCGTENKPESKFCVQCGAALGVVQQKEPAESDADSSRQSAYRSPGWQRSGGSIQRGNYAQNKTPVVAAVLSFLITGVGQFYNGDTKKGVLMLGGAAVLFFIIPFLVIPVWIWSMVDAYQVADGKKPLWN